MWYWKDLALRANENAAGKIVYEPWSCSANFKQIRKNDRAFLVKLGKEKPKGIMASGWISSLPKIGPHFDPEKAALGKKAHYVDCDWEKLLNPYIDEPLPISKLQKGKLAGMHWTPQNSGILIPDEIANELEELWKSHTGKTSLGSVFADDEIKAFEGEEKITFIRHRKREQKLRDAKLNATKHENQGRLICEVPGCGFNFEKVYGQLGKDFAHVHHLKPLGDRESPSETSIDDLAIVCANCHAMIHRGGKCRSLDKLIP
jgi:5-methylcytosine-specific restriction protein A